MTAFGGAEADPDTTAADQGPANANETSASPDRAAYYSGKGNSGLLESERPSRLAGSYGESAYADGPTVSEVFS
jgi:hypothetical protein